MSSLAHRARVDEEFANTVALLERVRFDVIHAAAYSPRPGTFAYRHQPDDVPLEVKKERLQVVEALHADSAARINRGLLGGIVEVLVEREEEGRSTGRARGGTARALQRDRRGRRTR